MATDEKGHVPRELSPAEQRIVTFALLHGYIHASLEFNMPEDEIRALVRTATKKPEGKDYGKW